MRPEATILRTSFFLVFLQRRPTWPAGVQVWLGGSYQNKVLTSSRSAGVIARVDGSSWLHDRKII